MSQTPTPSPETPTPATTAPSPRRRWRYWLLGVVALLLALITLLWGLLGTVAGSRWLLTKATSYVPGLSIGATSGTLLDDLQLENVHFQQSDGTDIHLARLHLQWHPASLLSLSPTLVIQQLDAEEIRLKLPASAPQQPSSTPFTLPDIALPLNITLASVKLQSLDVQQGDGPVQHIDEATLSAQANNSDVTLQQITLHAPQGDLALTGSLTPSGDYPLNASLIWHATLPDLPPLQGEGKVAGALGKTLTLTQEVSGAGSLKLTGDIQSLLTTPTWQATLEANQLALKLASPSLAESTLSGHIEASGTDKEARVTATLDTALAQTGPVHLHTTLQSNFTDLNIEKATLTLPGDQTEATANTEQTKDSTTPASKADAPITRSAASASSNAAPKESQKAASAEVPTLILSGSIKQLAGPQQLDLKAHWQALQYPLQGAADYQSNRGDLTLTGPLDHYALQGTLALSGKSVPSTQASLNGSGNLQGFETLALTLNTLKGTLAANGKLSWAPAVAWQFDLNGKGLNPGVQWPDVDGTVNFALATHGSVQGATPDVTAEISSLSGTLHQQPVKGQGSLRLANQSLEINQLNLSWGNAKLISSGKLADQLHLDWALSATDLHKLMPSARGALSLNGTLTGTREAPVIEAKGTASSLGYGENRLQKLDTRIALDLGWKKPASLQLEASGIQLGSQRLDQVSLKGSGTEHRHALTLNAKGPDLRTQLTMNGDWQDAKRGWKGQISQWTLYQRSAGGWKLNQPAPLQATASSARLGQLCLSQSRRGDGTLCAQGEWSASKGTSGSASLRALPLAMLTGALSGTEQVDGTLEAKVDFSQPPTGFPRYEATASVQGARLTLPGEKTSITLDQVALTAKGAKDNLDARLQLALNQLQGHLNAALNISHLSKEGSLRGQLDTSLQDLSLVSVFVPQLQEIKGQLNGNVNLSGSVRKPQVRGHLALTKASAAVPVAGLELTNLNVTLKDDPINQEQMQVEGSATSGKGQLAITGMVAPLDGKVDIRLKGQDFQAMNTEDIKARISPDIHVQVEPSRITVNGEVTVPQALISPPHYESAITSSGDTVIVTDQQQDASDLPGKQSLDIALRLNLGKDVRVDAFGFKGRLEGSLMVNQSARRAATASGNINVAAGQYRVYGQDLNIDRGSLVFTGGPINNPGLDMRVTRDFEADNVTVGARVSGTLRSPNLALFSDPTMPNSSQLSYLLLGKGPDAASSSEQDMLMRAALALGAKGGNSILTHLGSALNIDDIGIDTGDALGAASFYIGKYLTPSLYVKYGVGLIDPANNFLVRYKLTNHLNFESQAGTTASGADLFYTLEK